MEIQAKIEVNKERETVFTRGSHPCTNQHANLEKN